MEQLEKEIQHNLTIDYEMEMMVSFRPAGWEILKFRLSMKYYAQNNIKSSRCCLGNHVKRLKTASFITLSPQISQEFTQHVIEGVAFILGLVYVQNQPLDHVLSLVFSALWCNLANDVVNAKKNGMFVHSKVDGTHYARTLSERHVSEFVGENLHHDICGNEGVKLFNHLSN